MIEALCNNRKNEAAAVVDRSDQTVHPKWWFDEISFEQFFSLLHTEQTLIDLFEKKSDWSIVMNKIKNPDNFDRSPSVTGTGPSTTTTATNPLSTTTATTWAYYFENTEEIHSFIHRTQGIKKSSL